MSKRSPDKDNLLKCSDSSLCVDFTIGIHSMGGLLLLVRLGTIQSVLFIKGQSHQIRSACNEVWKVLMI
jgi:hypothetical protein